MVFLLLLGACSEGKAEKANGLNDNETQNQNSENKKDNDSSEPTIKEVNFGEKLYIEMDHRTPGGTELYQYNLTINDYEITQDVTTHYADMGKYDYVVVNFKLENVGSTTISQMSFGKSNFKLYDKDNIEINRQRTINKIEEETFALSEIRPNGVFKRRMYLPIPKNSEPVMMIFNPDSFSFVQDEMDEYIYHLK